MSKQRTMDKIVELSERVSKLETKVSSLEQAIEEMRSDMKELKKSQRINTIIIRYVIPLLQMIIIALGLR
jgi:outer membrane murein-binding lipoprotein Lpp